MNKGTKGWIWGAAIGTVLGGVTALLFAPKPGRELRKDIADGARQVSEKTQQVAEKVGEQSSQLAGKVKETAESLVNDFQTWRAAKGNADGNDQDVQISSFGEEETVSDGTAVIGIAEEAVAEAAAVEEQDQVISAAAKVEAEVDVETEGEPKL